MMGDSESRLLAEITEQYKRKIFYIYNIIYINMNVYKRNSHIYEVMIVITIRSMRTYKRTRSKQPYFKRRIDVLSK